MKNWEVEMNEHTTCVVAGGGPAGMVLALLLARAGVDVTVLEKHGDFLRDFRGDTVHPSTMTLLDELGLGEAFAALPHSELSEVSIPAGDDGRALTVADFRLLKAAHPYVAMVPQWDLLDLLADAGRAEPHFHLMMDTEVTGLLREHGRVTGVRYRTAGGREGEIPAELTVGCDGRWSAVRTLAGLRPREFPVPMDTWWFRLPREGAERATLVPRMRHGHFAVVIPREGYFQIAYLAPKGVDARLRAEGIGAFRARIAEVLPELAGRVGKIESMDDVKHLDVRLNLLRRWHVDGALCIGDAAHAMSPIGGVGINLAVQDAVATARLLAGPLLRGRVTARDLVRVHRRRLLPTILVQLIQRTMHRGIIRPVIEGRRNGPPKTAVRVLNLIPPARYVPAYLIGVGLLPEHAPLFARR
jgi:2-polyprenyl-6-methoxyphenol hydroxylase-like FAD-dependent oxidoreductase